MKRILAVAAVASALTLTAACGSTDAGSSGGSSSSSVSAAAASVHVGDTVSMADLGTRMSTAMRAKGSVSMSMTAPQVTMTGAMKVADPLAYTMSMKASGQSIDMIYVDKDLYLGGSAFASMLDGRQWVRLDPNGTDALSRQLAPMLKQMESAGDPSKMYAGMSDVTMTVAAVGADTVTYAATLTRAQIAAFAKQHGQTIPSGAKVGDLTIRLVLTRDGLPQKATTHVDGQDVVVTYRDWGAPVHIAAPPADQVGTMPAD